MPEAMVCKRMRIGPWSGAFFESLTVRNWPLPVHHHHIGRGSIDAFAQLLAGFEVRYISSRNMNRCSGFRIAPSAWWAVIQTETSKVADFDPPASCQRTRDGIEHLIYRNGGVLCRQMGEARGKDGDELSARHGA